jgi:hypothetical protein
VKICISAVSLAVLALAMPVKGEIVVDHSWPRSTGVASDTLYTDPDYGQRWTQCADDVVVSAPATVTHVTWWGGYMLDQVPSSETMRIRLYGSRTGDDLPSSVLWEATSQQVARSATGLVLPMPAGSSGRAAEYRYDWDLTAPFTLSANVPYWLEIVQLGDVNSMFVWDGMAGLGNGFAYLQPG